MTSTQVSMKRWAILVNLHEATQEGEPDLLALLRVELDGEEVPSGQPGAEGAAVAWR